eukprot:scaffold2415_cov98-Skeletonema_dohrnii-CCMP3373.AAC.1
MAVNRGAVGQLRCLIRTPKTLQRGRYVEQMLEPCKRWFYTIMANYNGSLQAVDCDIHGVRYDMAVNRGAVGQLRCPSGHLRRCSEADMSNKCLSRAKDGSILSWPTIMGHYKLWIATFTA